ncbi:MAG: polysulfide reductase NrfD [Eggerthellaceae bacterium]|nr:polysulfide reductase NrfD [Eggerthellaceae bacterium]
MVWGPLIAVYLFLAGAAAGAYLAESFISFKYPTDKKTRRWGRIIVPVLLGVGLLMLMIDAEAGFKNPLRFFGLVNNPASVMTIGVYIICMFMPISLVVAVLELFHKNVPRWLDIIGDIGAVCLAGYTGFLLGDSLGVPLWHNSILPALFLVSALTSGIAIVSLLGFLGDESEFEKMRALRPIHIVATILELILIALMLFIAVGKGAAGAASVEMILSGQYAVLFWLGLIGIGLVLPLALDVFTAGTANDHKAGALAVEASGHACVLVGGFLLRFIVVMAGVTMILF